MPAAGLALLLASPAAAAERDYCPTRPGLGTPACTISPGRVSVETGLLDWTREEDQTQRTDTVLISDTVVRLGLTDSIEAQLGWTPFGHARTRDKLTGQIDAADRTGDVTLGLKANLAHPDGSGLSLAVAPFLTVPVGRSPIGGGDWGAGLVVPVSYDLSKGVNLQFTPEVDAAVDADGAGRHLAFSGVVGIGIAIGKAVTTTIELQALRDEEPGHPTTRRLAALSLAWMADDDLQFDAGAVAGLDADAPDAEFYFGVSRRF